MFLIGGSSVHISDPHQVQEYISEPQLPKPTSRSRIHQHLALERNEFVPN